MDCGSAHQLSFHQLGHLDTYHTFFHFFYYVMYQKRHIHTFRPRKELDHISILISFMVFAAIFS